jgi:hypothetical protein
MAHELPCPHCGCLLLRTPGTGSGWLRRALGSGRFVVTAEIGRLRRGWTSGSAPGVSGEMLRPPLESGADLRMHVNNGAVASFVDTIPLLHPYGRLICCGLFVTDVHAYQPDGHQHRRHDCPGAGLR